jgi:hypothetical protein
MTKIKVGYALSGLAIVFLIFDSALKVLQLPVAMQATTELGLLGRPVLARRSAARVPSSAEVGPAVLRQWP